MKTDAIRLTKAQRKAATELGRIGGLTRAQKLTAEQRREIAVTASKAAVRARKARLK